MKKVETTRPSFPEFPANSFLEIETDQIWQVLCGDTGNYRIGVYSPAATSVGQIEELEEHDCPELFLLLEGELSLLLVLQYPLTQ